MRNNGRSNRPLSLSLLLLSYIFGVLCSASCFALTNEITDENIDSPPWIPSDILINKIPVSEAFLRVRIKDTGPESQMNGNLK